MKILYVTQLFYPALFGGGEYIFYQWAQEMTKKGHQVFVITQNIEGASTHETIQGIEIFRVGSTLRLSGTLPAGVLENLSFLFSAFSLGKKIAKENQIDIIHSNTYIPVIAAQWCANKLGIPHIATVHDVYLTSKKDFWKAWSEQSGISKLTKITGPLLEKKIARMRVSVIHTVSEKSREDLEGLGAKRIKVIPNGIDPTQYKTQQTIKRQAIFVGRLVFYKNLDVILEAFVHVIKKIPEASLVIVGDGPIKNNLVQKAHNLGIKESVTFTGTISDKEKIRLISESAVLVNPSLVEGFGIVVLEGFACGKPVIVSDSKPLSDLVDDSKDGYIVSSSDSLMWAQKIIEIFSDKEKAEQMGEAGRKKVLSNYDISKLANNLLEMYDSVKNKSTK